MIQRSRLADRRGREAALGLATGVAYLYKDLAGDSRPVSSHPLGPPLGTMPCSAADATIASRTGGRVCTVCCLNGATMHKRRQIIAKTDLYEKNILRMHWLTMYWSLLGSLPGRVHTSDSHSLNYLFRLQVRVSSFESYPTWIIGCFPVHALISHRLRPYRAMLSQLAVAAAATTLAVATPRDQEAQIGAGSQGAAQIGSARAARVHAWLSPR
ncbi:hypothetical protein MRX96_012784 [Rhipicephalus microplus]